MSQVSKLYNFFLTCLETEETLIFEIFDHCNLWKNHFQLSSTFLTFFIWSVNCWSRFFSISLLVSKLFETSIWIMLHILEMPRNLNINLYLQPFSIAIYEKLSKLFFLYSFEAVNLVLRYKLFKVFLYLCTYFFQKTTQLILKHLP